MIYILLCLIVIVMAWNFIPSIRERMRGITTILESVIAGVAYYGGVVTDGLKEAQAAGVIPDGIESYIPMLFFAWIIFKRVVTKTKVGERSANHA